MPLEGGQTRTGVEREESGPVGGRKTGDSGQTGGQSGTGYEREESGPVGGNKSGDPGLDAGQKRIGVERDPSSEGSKEWPAGRLDEVREVG